MQNNVRSLEFWMAWVHVRFPFSKLRWYNGIRIGRWLDHDWDVRSMTESEEINRRRWLGGWKEASERMAAFQKEDLQRLDIARVMEDLDDAFESALLHSPPASTSGPVIQQAWFAKGTR